MPSGVEGSLAVTVRMRVGPEPEGVELIKRYREALRYSVN